MESYIYFELVFKNFLFIVGFYLSNKVLKNVHSKIKPKIQYLVAIQLCKKNANSPHILKIMISCACKCQWDILTF